MNTKHILDLTLRLSQALDQNYDVVNMDTVVSVISALEGTTITKEQLETTRLAKYINQLRRRTRCENLARRAKSLLKRWREMVGMQQTNDTSAPASNAVYVPPSTAITSSSTTTNTLCNMPVSDNAVSNSHLTNPQFSHQQYQIPQQCQINAKPDQIQHQLPYRSEPSSPVNMQEKSNPNEFIMSISNPAAGPQVPKSSNTNTRKKRKLEKNTSNESTTTQQPTSFANLLTGLGNSFATSRKSTRDKAEPETSTVKPVETFIIEHSSNSNSDLICIPTNNTVNSNYTSVTDVPPVVIDLQDTNSSMNSLVSKDVTNVSSTSYRNKVSTKKAKKEKKRKDRNITLRQNQPMQDCDDQNATTTSYQNKQPSDVLLLDEKSHSVCPTLSNISEILSLSNSSMSSVFPSADAMSKNLFTSGQNELSPSTAKMNKSELTFAGKFKQNTSSITTGCNIINYNNDSINTNAQTNNSLNQNKFSMFGTNSNDSSSSSRTSSFHDAVYTAKREASNSMQGIESFIKHDVNEKSMSNMSHKGSSYTDNSIALGVSASTGAQQQQQQQQSIDLTNEVSSQKVIKTPKKRGRKKGSKGVDSVIAKETSLSSQMLLTPLGVAGKKVKTTKELYAEMESRKLRNVKAMLIGEKSANSVEQQQPQTQKPVVSRCPSLSDIADTDSCTMTSEQSRDSGNTVNKAVQGKGETHLDNNSNYSKNDSEMKTADLKSDENSRLLADESSVIETTAKIKLEIQEILKLLRPPPSIKEIEHECFNSITPCTCTVEEVTVPIDNETIVASEDNDSKESSLNATNSTNIRENETKQLRIQNEQIVNASEKLQLAEKSQKVAPVRPSPPPAKIKKSIFDLDFDDDEDPLNSIIADIEGKNLKIETEIKPISHEAINDKIELPPKTEDDPGKIDHQNLPFALNVPNLNTENIVFPSYEIKCDPNCEAKNRFEIQTQKITKFHVDTLHNCYIPNVNGNWSHADAIQLCSAIKNEDSSQELNAVVDGYDVVPLYGSDVNEQIAKDLSHIKFSKKHNAKHSKRPNSNEVLFHIPFLGVSRMPDIDDTKLRSKDLKKLSSDDEKENVDYKSNLENILLNTSALDADDAKEKIEMEGSEQIVEKSSVSSKLRRKTNRRKRSFKRTRRRESLIKRSTIKHEKRAVNETLVVSTCDSNDFHKSEELKLHKSLFYHDELYVANKNDIHLSNECIFYISSCSSSCSSVDEDETNERLNYRFRLDSTSSSSSSESEYNVLNLQREIFQSELKKRSKCAAENNLNSENDLNESFALESKESGNNKSVDDGFLSCADNDLPVDNNHMLLSFNNIYKKSTRDENAEQNKDHENNMLKQQLHNCDDYNNLNNFNLIKYIENKNSSVNNINNNNNSCSNNNSEANINISSSGSENPNNPAFTHHHSNNDNDVQSRPFKEYQTGMRAVDEDVNDDDGNNCGRLQQFKEWHEVLQLRSYNDELLTVLPYVLLD